MASQPNARTGAKVARSAAPSDFPKTQLVDVVLSLLVPGLILGHLVAAPFTKVEESFNIQAAHDVLVFGTPTSDVHQRLSSTYDHFTFPGAVPRTFIGPVLLAGFAQPVVALVGFQHAQLVVRAVLGCFNAACLLVFARSLRQSHGAGAARWFLLLQASQFHVIFYASRTLPNMFAFGLTTLASAFLIPQPGNPRSTARRQRLSITMFVFAAVIFRSEVALLLGTSILYLLLVPEISLDRVIFPFATSCLVSLAISVPIDSYFWQRPLWPELWGFYYNVVQGSASNWGVSPWHYYFTSALPRLLVNPLTYAFLIPRALSHPALRRAAARLAVPPLLFVAIYSLQPHKETRFIFYAVPPLTACAALAANFLFTRRTKSAFAALLAAALLLSVLVSFLASSAMLALSALNYPGGEALSHLRRTVLLANDPEAGGAPPVLHAVISTTFPDETFGGSIAVVPVHADVLACMTGVTLFGTSTAASAAEAGTFASASLRWLSSASLDVQHDNNNNDKNNKNIMKKNKKVRTTASSSSASPDSISSQEEGEDGSTPRIAIALDKTENPATLSRPSFWRQFAYLLVEDPGKVPVAGAVSGESEWEVVAVVQGYAGIEVVTPAGPSPDPSSSASASSSFSPSSSSPSSSSSSADDSDSDSDSDSSSSSSATTSNRSRAPVVGNGAAVARWKDRVRAVTGGWWVGPRMADRIYILRRADEATAATTRRRLRAAVAVEAR